MQYEETKIKAPGKDVGHKVLVNAAKRLSTMQLLWIIIVRHKIGILATGNIILVLNFIFPPWFDMLLSLVR